jgi:gas vesicle protein
MQVSRIIKKNLFIDSKAYSDLSPNMKDAVKDVFKLLDNKVGNIVERFDNAIKEVAALHNLTTKQIEDYFDKEVIEKLGEK